MDNKLIVGLATVLGTIVVGGFTYLGGSSTKDDPYLDAVIQAIEDDNSSQDSDIDKLRDSVHGLDIRTTILEEKHHGS